MRMKPCKLFAGCQQGVSKNKKTETITSEQIGPFWARCVWFRGTVFSRDSSQHSSARTKTDECTFLGPCHMEMNNTSLGSKVSHKTSVTSLHVKLLIMGNRLWYERKAAFHFDCCLKSIKSLKLLRLASMQLATSDGPSYIGRNKSTSPQSPSPLGVTISENNSENGKTVFLM